MKKLNILLLLLAIFVALTVLVSCGEQGAQDTDSNIKENQREEATDESYFSFYPLDDGTLAIECNSDIIKYLTKIVIPAKHNGKIVSKIGENAFEGFTNIKTIVIPDSITKICYSAFKGCTNLINIEIPNSVTSIGNYAFSGCSNLVNIEIPNSVLFIGSSAFNGCSSLESITLPFVGNGIDQTHFGYIFGASSYSDNSWYVPTSLKSVTITGSTSIGSSAFYGCSNLTSVVIPNSVTSIGKSAFYGCSHLASITLPFVGDGIDQTHFGYIFGALSYSYNDDYIPTGLKSVTLTGGTSIGERAFYRCYNLTRIVIPNSVASVDSYAFVGCSNLTIYCEAESEPSGWGSWWNSSNCPVVWGYKG